MTPSLRRAVAAFGMLAVAGWAIAAPPSLEPATRDQVWRRIFARPEIEIATGKTGAQIAAQAALGAKLFADRRLSRDETTSCATCHDPAQAFTDGRERARARDGTPLQRNTPTLYNLGQSTAFFADGRVNSLEHQAIVPLTATNEMGGELATITAALRSDAALAAEFAAAFPATPEVSDRTLIAAITAYERTLVSPGTRFDRWVEGDDTALSQREQAGFSMFAGKGGCVGWHGGWRFTDDGFRDIGLPGDDPGRSAVVGGAADLRQFKTPTLRELTRTAPYMHDGSLATLRQVVDHYAGGFVKRPSLDSNLVRDLSLSPEEKSALIAFLETLSSD